MREAQLKKALPDEGEFPGPYPAALPDRQARWEAAVPAYLVSPHPLVLREWILSQPPPGITFSPVRLLDAAAPTTPELTTPGALVVLDACLPAGVTRSLIDRILCKEPTIRVVVVMEELSPQTAFPLLRLGVKGLLTYADGTEALRSALALVARGGMWVPRDLLSTFLDGIVGRKAGGASPAPGGMALSRREREVLDGLVENLSNKEIGTRLFISERTVKFHVSNLLAKFAVPRRGDLIVRSIQIPRSLDGNLY
jgi:DNA-binding NarL/FixJ family response regulator